jgi:hypothetical protein
MLTDGETDRRDEANSRFLLGGKIHSFVVQCTEVIDWRTLQKDGSP